MHKERILAAILTAAACLSLTACGREAAETPGSGVENGVAAIDKALKSMEMSQVFGGSPIIND